MALNDNLHDLIIIVVNGPITTEIFGFDLKFQLKSGHRAIKRGPRETVCHLLTSVSTDQNDLIVGLLMRTHEEKGLRD